jgi:hypothetical protein
VIGNVELIANDRRGGEGRGGMVAWKMTKFVGFWSPRRVDRAFLRYNRVLNWLLPPIEWSVTLSRGVA